MSIGDIAWDSTTWLRHMQRETQQLNRGIGLERKDSALTETVMPPPPSAHLHGLTCAAESHLRGKDHGVRAQCSTPGTHPCHPRVRALSSASTPDTALRPGDRQLEHQAAAPCGSTNVASKEHTIQSSASSSTPRLSQEHRLQHSVSTPS